MNVAAAAKRIGVAEFTVYRWRKQMGGMSKPDAKRLTDLEKENAMLKRLLAEKEFDNSILEEAPRKVLTADRKRSAVRHVTRTLRVSERRACTVTRAA